MACFFIEFYLSYWINQYNSTAALLVWDKESNNRPARLQSIFLCVFLKQSAERKPQAALYQAFNFDESSSVRALIYYNQDGNLLWCHGS